MPKFTQGQWRAAIGEKQTYSFTVYAQDGHAYTHDRAVAEAFGNTPDEARANALLISAGPALLKALKRCLDNSKLRRASGVESGPVIELEIAEAKAAIALVDGGAS